MTDRTIAVIGTGFTATGGDAPPPGIEAVRAPGFRPRLVETRYGGFPLTPADRALTAIGYVEAGIRAASAGATGIFINTFGDYGIESLRSALAIPVVGAGQSALALATTLGRRCAIVSIWPPALRFIFEERLEACQLTGRGIEILSVLDHDLGDMGSVMGAVGEMRQGQAEILGRVVAVAEGAIRRGADVIVLGCTCMAPVAPALAARLPVPVIDPMRTGYKATETLIALGLGQSARAYPRAGSATLDAFEALVARDPQADKPGAALDGAAPDCPVCVIAAD